jgi:hypothetical protein
MWAYLQRMPVSDPRVCSSVTTTGRPENSWARAAAQRSITSGVLPAQSGLRLLWLRAGTGPSGLLLSRLRLMHPVKKGIKVTNAEFTPIRVTPDEFHRNWNYAISPHTKIKSM